MSQNIKLNMLIGADQAGIIELSKIYHACRIMRSGFKAIAPKLKENIDVPSIRAEYDMVIGRIAYYKNKMLQLRAQIYDKIHTFVERYAAGGYAQPATAAPAVAVDQNVVNELRRQLDANPQLKAQVQALLLTLALQTVPPQQ